MNKPFFINFNLIKKNQYFVLATAAKKRWTWVAVEDKIKLNFIYN